MRTFARHKLQPYTWRQCTAAIMAEAHAQLAALGDCIWPTSAQALLRTCAGRTLLHWAVLKGTDKMLEACIDWLLRLQAETGQPGPAERAPTNDSGPLRAILLRTDQYGDTAMHLAARSNDPMKVYTLAKVDPWTITWVCQGHGEPALASAARELDQCTTKLKTSEVRAAAAPFCTPWLLRCTAVLAAIGTPRATAQQCRRRSN